MTALIQQQADLLIIYSGGTTVLALPDGSDQWSFQGGFIVPTPASEFVWPFNFNYIVSEFGTRPNPFPPPPTSFHSGVDLAQRSGAVRGAPIPVAGKGSVVAAGWNVAGGWGNSVIVDHGNGLRTGYAHMLEPPYVSAGQSVRKGDTLGIVGSTGLSQGNHLHFTTWVNGALVNPRTFMATHNPTDEIWGLAA